MLGYIVSGTSALQNTNAVCNLTIHSFHSTSSLEKLVNKFWETEKVPELFKEHNTEQEACENSFQASVVRKGQK